MRNLLILVIAGSAINAHASPTSFQEKLDTFGQEWITDKLSIRVNTDHYAWSGSNNSSGWQNITPITATYRLGNAEVGLRTAYIFSENTTEGRRGYVDTLSDTALSFAYTQQLPDDWNIRFNVDYNAPTGKATLTGTEKNAIMDGNLVFQTRFGEGHNVTPGIVITKVLAPSFSLGAGASHTIRGSYDPNGDVNNDQLNPGDETHFTLQGQYATPQMMFIGGAIYTKSDVTTVNHQDYFQKGDRIDVNFTGIFALPYDQTFITGFRYGTQAKDTYINNITGNFEKEQRNINGDNFYVSLEYRMKFYDNHAVKLLGDWLKFTSNSYNQFNDLYNAGREKYAFGLGYGYQFNKKSNFSASLRKFHMDDNATPATLRNTKYDGWNLSAELNWLF